MFDQQAWHFEFAAAGLEGGAVLGVVAGVSGFHVQTLSGQFFTDFDTKRTGFELVKSQLLGGPIQGVLLFWAARQGAGRRELFAKEHEWGEDEANGAEEVADDDFHVVP